ncbi:MAG: nucleoid occlusion factor SlmA [Burkholderiales bacterium]|jgi:TetR/AcrR family transcriptional regulator|nr:nucleoid occlusion factor SlmA [Burkholderiales bacterium]
MAARKSERRAEILQSLATMLENPSAEKITTSAIASRLNVSEAALYRHFASKAQMFDELIEYIEKTLFSQINKIQSDTLDGAGQIEQILYMLLRFAEKNPGMMRVITGEAIVHENDRLQQRVNQIFDKLEAAIRQSFRIAQLAQQIERDYDIAAHAAVLIAFVAGRWQLFVKTGFKSLPHKHWDGQKVFLLGSALLAQPQVKD